MKAIKLKATTRLDFEYEISNEREVRMYEKTKVYDLVFDGNSINADVCDQMIVEYKMARFEEVDCMMLATGLSGSGKTSTLMEKFSGLIFRTLRELWVPHLRIRTGQIDLVNNCVNDLSFADKPKVNGWSWFQLEAVEGSTCEEMISLFSSFIDRRDTKTTRNNHT